MLHPAFFQLLRRCRSIIPFLPAPCALAAALKLSVGRPCPVNEHLSISQPISSLPAPPLPSLPHVQNDTPLQRVFQLFDSNNDQLVSIAELREGLAKLGISLAEEQLATLVTSASEKEVGQLEFHEFKFLYDCLFADGTSTEHLLEAFSVFDLNGDGFISVSELQTVLSNMGFLQCNDESFCESILHRIDANSDGRIDFSEFRVMMSDVQCSNSSCSSLESCKLRFNSQN